MFPTAECTFRSGERLFYIVMFPSVVVLDNLVVVTKRIVACEKTEFTICVYFFAQIKKCVLLRRLFP